MMIDHVISVGKNKGRMMPTVTIEERNKAFDQFNMMTKYMCGSVYKGDKVMGL